MTENTARANLGYRTNFRINQTLLSYHPTYTDSR